LLKNKSGSDCLRLTKLWLSPKSDLVGDDQNDLNIVVRLN